MRRRRAIRREVLPDPKFNNKTVSRFVNMLMLQGKKWNAERIVYGSLDIVTQKAQKTDAMQTNKNLLLSREALVNSTPALEIRADDVKCRHGSTIGQLDESAMFYLRSRGLGEAQARALLIYAFAADISNRIKVAPIREGIERFLGLTLPVLAGDRSVPRAPWGTALFQETS